MNSPTNAVTISGDEIALNNTGKFLRMMADMHTEDQRPIQPDTAPGQIVAEFACGRDARNFAHYKGPGFTVTPGINHLFAVRMLVQVTHSQRAPLVAV